MERSSEQASEVHRPIGEGSRKDLRWSEAGPSIMHRCTFLRGNLGLCFALLSCLACCDSTESTEHGDATRDDEKRPSCRGMQLHLSLLHKTHDTFLPVPPVTRGMRQSPNLSLLLSCNQPTLFPCFRCRQMQESAEAKEGFNSSHLTGRYFRLCRCPSQSPPSPAPAPPPTSMPPTTAEQDSHHQLIFNLILPPISHPVSTHRANGGVKTQPHRCHGRE